VTRHSNNGTVVHDGGSVRVGDSPYCPHLNSRTTACDNSNSMSALAPSAQQAE